MRLTVLAVTAMVAASAVASAASAAPSPQPSVSPSAPAQAMTPTALGDQEIQTLLVGNSYTVDWHEGKQLTIDVHPDGTLHGYISAGLTRTSRMSSGVTRDQDDGKYTIEKGLYCWSWMGAWASRSTKPTCAHVTKTADGYMLGTSLMSVTLGKH